MPTFDLEHPPWSEEAGGTGDSDDWGDEQDRSEWFADAAHHYADRAAKLERELETTRRFVYLVDRDDEIDVYADFHDAHEACHILGANYSVVEQLVFLPSSDEPSTRDWLNELRRYAD